MCLLTISGIWCKDQWNTRTISECNCKSMYFVKSVLTLLYNNIVNTLLISSAKNIRFVLTLCLWWQISLRCIHSYMWLTSSIYYVSECICVLFSILTRPHLGSWVGVALLLARAHLRLHVLWGSGGHACEADRSSQQCRRSWTESHRHVSTVAVDSFSPLKTHHELYLPRSRHLLQLVSFLPQLSQSFILVDMFLRGSMYDLQVVYRSNGLDQTPPTVWTLQRLPWNPGACGMGELWGYKYTPMSTYVLYLAIDTNSQFDLKPKSLTVVHTVYMINLQWNPTPQNNHPLTTTPEEMPTVIWWPGIQVPI